VIIMQVHYNTSHTSSVTPVDLTTVELQLEDAVDKEAVLLPIPNTDFSLPPQQVTTDSITVPALGRRVWGLLPHMHQLGTSISVVTAGHGCLIRIPSWDFNWQQSYFFADVDNVALGTLEAVTLECTWNNTNVDRIVEWGEGTGDEMCLAYAYTTGQ